MRSGIFSALFLAFLTSAAATPALAQRNDDRDGIQPLDRLLPEIRRQHPGNFYDAEGPRYGPNGDPHYHLKWMTPDGRVIWFDTDARNGRVLRSSPGRDRFDRSRFGGSFESRPGFDRRGFDRGGRGWDGPRGGGIGRREGRGRRQ